MSVVTQSNGVDPARRRSRPSSRLERAYLLYRKRVALCRTENQRNRVHIAVENYMTPAELRYFASALAADAPDSPSHEWITRLGAFMPTQTVRPVEFERRTVLKGMTHYTAGIGSPPQKTLLIGFAGGHHRLMLPMPSWLDCLNPAFYDMIVLRDFSRRIFTVGIPGLGADFFEAMAGLRRRVDLNAYRNTIAVGTSSGGLPALLGAIELRLDRGIWIGGLDFPTLATRLRSGGASEARYAALLASRPEPFPDLLLVYCGSHVADAAAANGLHQRVPSRLWEVRNCASHVVLSWKLERQRLPLFLSKILGQSLEHGGPVATGGNHDR